MFLIITSAYKDMCCFILHIHALARFLKFFTVHALGFCAYSSTYRITLKQRLMTHTTRNTYIHLHIYTYTYTTTENAVPGELITFSGHRSDSFLEPGNKSSKVSNSNL